jgi:hypothetical protein
MVAVAIGGAALIGGATQVISGNKQAGAIKDSAAQSDATNRYIFDTIRADNAPQRDIGYGALGKLADMYGVPRPTTMPSTGPLGQSGGTPTMYGVQPTAPSSSMTAGFGGFQESPGYRFRVDEATKAIERSAAARGGLRSGATMDALQRRVQGVASDEYENFANRLASLAGVGQTATNATSAAGQAYAGQQTQTNMAAGQARASAYGNTGSAINNGVQNLTSAYLYNSGYGGGGGFGGGKPVPGFGNA